MKANEFKAHASYTICNGGGIEVIFKRLYTIFFCFLLINPYLKETVEVHNKLRSTISNNQKEISKLENTVKSLNNKLSQAEVFQALETRQIALSAIAGERGFFKQSLNTIIQRIDSLLIDAENLNAIKIKCQEFLK